MKFMVAWKIPPGCYQLAAERFLTTGAPNPPGVTTIGRWHAPGSTYGWHVVEGDHEAAAEGLGGEVSKALRVQSRRAGPRNRRRRGIVSTRRMA